MYDSMWKSAHGGSRPIKQDGPVAYSFVALDYEPDAQAEEECERQDSIDSIFRIEKRIQTAHSASTS